MYNDDRELTSREEAERRLAGIILRYPKEADKAFEALGDGAIIKQDIYRQIYEAALAIHGRGGRLDRAAIKRQVEERGKLPHWWTMAMADAEYESASYPGEIQKIAAIIKQDAALRRFLALTKKAKTYEDALKCAQELIHQDTSIASDETPWPEVVDMVYTRAEAIRQGREQAGYSFGVDKIDETIRLCPGGMYCIAGIKKGAKSLFTLHILQHNLTASPPVPVLLFSLEMTAQQIAQKAISTQARVNSAAILSPRIDPDDVDRMESHREAVKRMPITVCDEPGISIGSLVSRAKRWKYRHSIKDGTGIICVDFLQYVNAQQQRGESEASAIKRVAYALAGMAKELRVAVIAVAQFRNDAEGEAPSIRYVEGSGGISQAAEGILICDYINRRTEYGDRTPDWPRRFDFIIGEQRWGESGVTISLAADLRYGVFQYKDEVDPVPASYYNEEGLLR